MGFKPVSIAIAAVAQSAIPAQSTAFPREMPHRSIVRQHIDRGAAFWFVRLDAHIDSRRIAASPEEAMSSMKDREEGFERKFAFDEELRFKATARRNKLLGLWAAEKLGKTGADAEPTPRKSSSPTSRKPATTTCSARCAGDFDAAGVDAVRPSDPPHDGRADGAWPSSRSRTADACAWTNEPPVPAGGFSLRLRPASG